MSQKTPPKGETAAYFQQHKMLLDTDHTNPQSYTQFITDLTTHLTTYPQTQYDIILGLDANEPLYPANIPVQTQSITHLA